MKGILEKRINQGFIGQRMIVLPKKVVKTISNNFLINSLYFTDIGFFPKAKNHFIQRQKGSKQHIIIYCREGQGILEMNNTRLILKPNTFCIIPPGIPHKYYSDSKVPWSIYWLHFTGIQASHFYTKFLELHTPAVSSVLLEERRISLFENLIDVLEDGYSISNIEYVNISLWQLLNSFLYQRYFIEVGRKHDTKDNLIQASIRYMKENLENSLRINDIAKHFNYSPSHYFSIFKSQTGYSPIHYFNHLKIQKACQLLCFSTLSIKEISFLLGFSDPLYFSRLFKKTMNASPSNYRKEYLS